MVRAGEDNEIIDAVEEKSLVAIGWAGMGNLSGLTTRQEVKKRYREAYPEDSDAKVNVNSGQMFRFINEMKKVDLVLTYNKSSREVLIGQIIGDYEWSPKDAPEYYPHVRRVKWEGKVSRDYFSTPARNTLGSSLTVFSLDEHITEVESLLKGERPPEMEEKEEAPPFFQDVQSKADELISDKISKIDPLDFQDLVAAVLRAMGYQTEISPRGADRGVDIIAHPDALGFEPPLIKVQVKHRTSSVEAHEMRGFMATLKSDEKGLYVSTGGYTREARDEAQRATPRISILDINGFINLLLENYEKMDPQYQVLIPLKKVYIPTQE